MVLPSQAAPDARYGSYFIQAPNGIATDEISAHTGIFDAKTNDGYYELGLLTAHLIRDVVITRRTSAEPVSTPTRGVEPTQESEGSTSIPLASKEPATASPSTDKAHVDDDGSEEDEDESLI